MKRASRWTGCVHHAVRRWGAPQFRMRWRRVAAARYVGPGRWSASDGQKGLACSEALKGVRPTAFSLSLVCTSRTRRGAVDPAPAARACRWRAPTAHGLRNMRICNRQCSVRSTGLTPWSEDVQHPGHVRCSADFCRTDNAHYVNWVKRSQGEPLMCGSPWLLPWVRPLPARCGLRDELDELRTLCQQPPDQCGSGTPLAVSRPRRPSRRGHRRGLRLLRARERRLVLVVAQERQHDPECHPPDERPHLRGNVRVREVREVAQQRS